MNDKEELYEEESIEEKEVRVKVEYYLGLELLWILTNISSGPD